MRGFWHRALGAASMAVCMGKSRQGNPASCPVVALEAYGCLPEQGRLRYHDTQVIKHKGRKIRWNHSVIEPNPTILRLKFDILLLLLLSPNRG